MKKAEIIICAILIVGMAIISNIVVDDLDGKTIAIIGDSLMEGYGNNDRSFEYYFSNLLPNSKFINNARSGSTISDNTGNDDIVILNQAVNLKGNPEIIFIDGGANDIIGYEIGFIDKSLKKDIGTADSVTSNTVISDLERTFYILQEKYPKAKIYFIQMFLIDDETIDMITLDESIKPEIRKRRDELFPEIKKLCQKMNIEYIDVSDKLIGTKNVYRQDDYIHLKEEGYQFLVPYILEKLQQN